MDEQAEPDKETEEGAREGAKEERVEGPSRRETRTVVVGAGFNFGEVVDREVMVRGLVNMLTTVVDGGSRYAVLRARSGGQLDLHVAVSRHELEKVV